MAMVFVRGVRGKHKKHAPSAAPAMTPADAAQTSGEAEEIPRRPEDLLTEQQMGELRATFESFDEDSSGFLCAPPPSPRAGAHPGHQCHELAGAHLQPPP